MRNNLLDNGTAFQVYVPGSFIPPSMADDLEISYESPTRKEHVEYIRSFPNAPVIVPGLSEEERLDLFLQGSKHYIASEFLEEQKMHFEEAELLALRIKSGEPTLLSAHLFHSDRTLEGPMKIFNTELRALDHPQNDRKTMSAEKKGYIRKKR